MAHLGRYDRNSFDRNLEALAVQLGHFCCQCNFKFRNNKQKFQLHDGVDFECYCSFCYVIAKTKKEKQNAGTGSEGIKRDAKVSKRKVTDGVLLRKEVLHTKKESTPLQSKVQKESLQAATRRILIEFEKEVAYYVSLGKAKRLSP